jgi:UDP-N-acetylglucosamine 1-carboxyvinyltransferase
MVNAPAEVPAIRIRGGAPLRGEVEIGGSKNLALPALAATLLTEERCVLDNVPAIEDTRVMLQILEALGATVQPDPREATFFDELESHHRVEVDAGSIRRTDVPPDLARQMRASILLLGPLLARCGAASTVDPGGDKIGARPIDVMLRGLERMQGKRDTSDPERIRLQAGRLQGTHLYLDYPSHTGTENLVMAAVLAYGRTTIINASCEPEVVELGRMLIDMGAKISGLGTPIVEIEGVPRLRGVSQWIMPDRLVAGTFAIAAAVTKGEIVIRNVPADDVRPVTEKLRESGVEVYPIYNDLKVFPARELRAVDIQSLPFPGFPTDQQAVFAALLTQANGTSRIHERVYEGRLGYVDDLNALGAQIEIDMAGGKATIHGPTPLRGGRVAARDIRAGAALVVAALATPRETFITEVVHIDRGYERLVEAMRRLGADITEEEVTDHGLQ